ncbi:hypothetical protein [Winogradskyella forsetii]|uniref:hypothetical protein n=1 Tax=Winogradskyella forsetii TaxID=2686077 RepID=UPI0015C040B7|nr:hypothetical protein [Winogradskyella forsetii]
MIISCNGTLGLKPHFVSGKYGTFILRTSDELIKTFSEYDSVYTVIDSFEEIKDDVI